MAEESGCHVTAAGQMLDTCIPHEDETMVRSVIPLDADNRSKETDVAPEAISVSNALRNYRPCSYIQYKRWDPNEDSLDDDASDDPQIRRFRMSPTSCIFTVPNTLRRHNSSAYEPIAISIGPLHLFFFKHTNRIKLGYQSGLVSRVGVPVERLVESVTELEPVARKHYGEKVIPSHKEFVEMLVLDGCFIIEYLRKFGDPSMAPEKDDPVFSVSYMYQHVIHDLMLLENQIPWTVLDRLFTLTAGENLDPQYSLPRLVLKFYRFVLPINCTDFEELARHLESPTTKYRHILELLRKVLIRGAPNLRSDQEMRFAEEGWDMLPPIPSATELENAGITLKNIKSNRLIISFNSGVLAVSPLRIDDTSEALFRNIIAFEQCAPGCSSAFTSYAILLDNLINTAEDLDRLRQKGIISYMLNPDDTVGFFNKLYNDIALNEFYYPDVCMDINAYCRRRWPRWRASLIRNYFSSPWVIVSTLAAFVLLVLTFLQTVYTMKG